MLAAPPLSRAGCRALGETHGLEGSVFPQSRFLLPTLPNICLESQVCTPSPFPEPRSIWVYPSGSGCPGFQNTEILSAAHVVAMVLVSSRSLLRGMAGLTPAISNQEALDAPGAEPQDLPRRPRWTQWFLPPPAAAPLLQRPLLLAPWKEQHTCDPETTLPPRPRFLSPTLVSDELAARRRAAGA